MNEPTEIDTRNLSDDEKLAICIQNAAFRANRTNQVYYVMPFADSYVNAPLNEVTVGFSPLYIVLPTGEVFVPEFYSKY